VIVVIALVGLAALSAPGVAWAGPPSITSFSPPSGPVGTSVNIEGTAFTGATSVKFNGVSATYNVVSDIQIEATVPVTTTGPISVTTPGGTATSSTNFKVTLGIALSKTVGPPKSTLAVSGTKFGATEALDIFFDLADLAIAATDGSGNFAGFVISVPASAVPGTHWVTAVGRHSGLAAQKPFLVQTDWPQFHRTTNHKGYNPVENVLSPSTVGGLTESWIVTTGDLVESSPSVAGGVVYEGSNDGKLYALNAQSGGVLWSASIVTFSCPAVAGGAVYVGSFDDHVYALDASTGGLLWSLPTGFGIESSPAVSTVSLRSGSTTVVFVSSGDGKVYAVNSITGSAVWTAAINVGSFSSPAVANHAVYVGSNGGKLFALRDSTGSVLWSTSIGPWVSSSPAVAGGVVYVGSGDGKIYALNATSGANLWSTNINGPVNASPAVAGGVVYSGSNDGKLYALNASTGAILWSLPGTFWDAVPAVAGGVLYADSTDEGKLYALNAATGSVLWTYLAGDRILGHPVVTDGRLYFGSDDHRIYAFDLASGQAAVRRPRPSSLRRIDPGS